MGDTERVGKTANGVALDGEAAIVMRQAILNLPSRGRQSARPVVVVSLLCPLKVCSSESLLVTASTDQALPEGRFMDRQVAEFVASNRPLEYRVHHNPSAE